jgi:hypothetical protein
MTRSKARQELTREYLVSAPSKPRSGTNVTPAWFTVTTNDGRLSLKAVPERHVNVDDVVGHERCYQLPVSAIPRREVLIHPRHIDKLPR